MKWKWKRKKIVSPNRKEGDAGIADIDQEINPIAMDTAKTDISQENNPIERRDKEMADRDDVATLTESVKDLVTAIVDGKLDVRADVEKVDTAYRPILKGINELVEAFVAPINVTAEYVDRISKGDIPEPITDEYRGDFNEIKNNLNQCID
ncbi:MAG: methyl-accepting chemotaxis protein, partial [Deltaproteobacteria bacterium]|nr:methyl-accepting chemotaxis protein [Deltaproteobacteria bacterium]MBW1911243.1 methyl-accepting chemotaxis protein [Deltaproteobacteria bacterium]